MPDSFEKARNMASLVRFQGEKSVLDGTKQPEMSVDNLWANLSTNALEISSELTPTIFKVLRISCDRLLMPIHGVRGYVYAGADMQATCIPINSTTCAIQISSSLVEALDEEELAFVIGHELGHFLLGHGRNLRKSYGDVEHLSLSRAQEFSCDRLGLIAASNPDAALRAIIKTVSGLRSTHLRFDTAAFLSKSLKDIESFSDPTNVYSTHPSLPVRARCLLWFSQFATNYYPNYSTEGARAEFEQLDKRVKTDVERFVEAPTNARLDQARHDTSSWIWLGAAVSDGKLSEREQQVLLDKFGESFLEKVKSNFEGFSINEVVNFVRNQAQKEIAHFCEMAPIASHNFVSSELEKSENEFLPDGTRNIVRE